MSEELEPCPFCGAPLFIRDSMNAYGRCETEDCWMHERKLTVQLDDPRQIAAWNTRTVTSNPGEDAIERAKLAENVQAWREHFSPDGKRIRLEGDNKAAICAVLDDVLAALSNDPQKEALLTAIDAWMADPSPATEQGIMDAREALSSTLSGGR